MTTQKDFKRLVRARMRKTGESYTAARAALMRRPGVASAMRRKASSEAAPALATRTPAGTLATRSAARRVHAAPAAPPSPALAASTPRSTPPAADLARLAGYSDQTIKAKTGCTWEKWTWALDRVNAHAWPHGEIARFVHEQYKVPGWWAQAVTVGYERIRGLRAKGQRRSGSWEASRSLTVNVAVGKLFRAFSQAKLRAAWLPGVTVVVRKSTPNKSIRITWEDGTSVEGWFTAKARSKSQVSVQHTKLKTKAQAERMKAFWTERLDAIRTLLAPAAP